VAGGDNAVLQILADCTHCLGRARPLKQVREVVDLLAVNHGADRDLVGGPRPGGVTTRIRIADAILFDEPSQRNIVCVAASDERSPACQCR
jgi:hypothetical protein